MADLFDAIDALFTKREIPAEEVPSSWILHRFLASDKDYALVARHVQPWVRSDAFTFAIWRAALPRLRKAPYLHYTAAKKRPNAEALETRLMEVYGYSRQQAEEALGLIEMMEDNLGTSGYAEEAYALRRELADYLGVDLEVNDAAADTE